MTFIEIFCILIVDMKNKIQEHPRNSKIEFIEEEHRYLYSCDNRKIDFKGVTSWISDYTKPFDPSIAQYIAYRDGITEAEVLDSWREAREYGNYVDEMISGYIDNGDNVESDEVYQFIQAMEEKQLTPICSEYLVYDEDIGRASAIDVLCLDKRGRIIVIDLKSMEKDIKYHGYQGQKMSYPLSSLEDSKYYKQALQVGIYHYWLKYKYDLDVSEARYVLRIRPDFYEWIPLMPVEKEINKLYKFENEK